MYNGVGYSNIKGTGLSGYVERSKAVAQRDTVTDSHVVKCPSQRSLRESEEAKRKLADHLLLRAIKLECAEMEESLSQQTVDGAPKYSREQVNSIILKLATERHHHYVAQKAQQGSGHSMGGSGDAPVVGQSSAPTDSQAHHGRFAAALGIRAEEPGTAFDQEAQEEAKEFRKAERRQKLEKAAAEKVLSSLEKGTSKSQGPKPKSQKEF
jgi:hypothetical protein